MQADHFESSVLEFLPSNLRSLDDKAESGSNGRGDMGMSFCDGERRKSLIACVTST